MRRVIMLDVDNKSHPLIQHVCATSSAHLISATVVYPERNNIPNAGPSKPHHDGLRFHHINSYKHCPERVCTKFCLRKNLVSIEISFESLGCH